MVGKNNHIKTVRSNLKEHYKAYKSGRNWVYAGIASLALGAGLLFGSTTTYADTAANTVQGPAESEASKTADAAATSQKATAVPLKAAQNTATNLNENTDATANSGSTTTKTADQSQATADSNAKTTNAASNASTSAQTSVSNDQRAAAQPTRQSSNPVTQPATTAQTSKKQTLVDPSENQLNAAKASAAQSYATTHQPQEIDAVDPQAAPGLTISENAIGTGTNAATPLVITLNANAKAGDIYQITIPADTMLYTFASVDSLQDPAGTTTTTQGADGSHIITDKFTTDSVTTQQIKLNLTSPYLAPAGMADVGKTVEKKVSFTINTVPQTGVSFTQTVKPTTKLSTVTMLHPDPSVVNKLLPNQDYVFGVSVNESDGIPEDTGTTNRVSKVDNYGGSKITIPVPAGFTLDTASTNQKNLFTDGTTITQPGGKGTDVIITVPPKAGSQVGNNGVYNAPEYQIVGAFNVPQTASDQSLTANGNVTFSQIINGDTTNNTITDQADPWKVTILANNGGTDVGQSGVAAIAKGNSSGNSSQLVLDNDPGDDPEDLNSFGFAFNSAANATDTKITINVPNGLDATSIQTPAQGITPSSYLPDTSSYQYTLTLANGQTETGTVAAGAKVTSTDGSTIRTAVFEPNAIAAGSYADASNDASSFSVKGHLAANYDDNTTAVKYNDKFTSSIDINFKAGDKAYEGKGSVDQTAVEGVAIGEAYLVTRPNNQTPGNPSAGTLQIRYDDFGQGQNTNSIDEPTFYFVLPKATTVASINSLTSMNDDPVHDSRYVADPTGAQLTQVTGAKVSEFTADNGQTVVKIDYAGTGKTVDLSQVTGHWGAITLANDPDALPGNYPYYVYISSPKTKLVNSTKPTDPSFVQNDPNAYLMGGENGQGIWPITTASSFFNTSLAKGNENDAPVDSDYVGTSDDKGSADMTFYDSIVYTSSETDAKDHNATAVINLPTVGDSKGSQYTFNLNGPITVSTNYSTSTGNGAVINPTVLYSTTPQQFNNTDTAPNTTGYMTADQVPANGGWSKIRSIIVQVKGIKPNTSTGRIEIKGSVADQTSGGVTTTFHDMAGKTGYLQTAFYGDGSKVVVNTKDAAVSITGTSTVKARYHYQDANNQDHYIEIPDLSQTVKDNVDTLQDDYPKQKADFDAFDIALIPAGYQLQTDAIGKVTRAVIDSKTDGPAELGQLAHYNDDGDYVQYELVHAHSTALPKGFSGQTTRTITYTGLPSNNPGPVSQQVTWTTDTDEVTGVTTYTPSGNYDAVNTPSRTGYTPDKTSVPAVTNTATTTKPSDDNITVTYTASKADLTVTYVDTDENNQVVGTPETLKGTTDKTGTYTVKNPDPNKYVLATGQAATVPYTFKAGNDTSDNLTIKLAHKHVTTLPDGFTGKTTRTITYTGAGTKDPVNKTEPVIWTTDTDEVTGVTTYTPSGGYDAVTTPPIAGYKPDKTSIPAVKNTATTTKPTDSTETVTYKADNEGLTVTYQDVDKGNAVVGTPVAINGTTDETGTYTAVAPKGYEFANKDQPTSINYTITPDDTDNIVIPVKHMHTNKLPDGFTGKTTRTITYTGLPSNNPGSVSQQVTWTTDTDEVTGVTTYTPSGNYDAVNTPSRTGYTPDKMSVPAVTNTATTTKPSDDNITVTYTASKADLTVTYVDTDENNQVVGTPETLNGTTDKTGTYTVKNPDPNKYVLANGQTATVPYTFKAGNDTSDNLTIKLAHKHVTTLPDGFTGKTTRTITYTGLAGGHNPKTVSQQVMWTTDTDEATGVTTYTPSGNYAVVNTPAEAGYTPDEVNVPSVVNAVTTTKPGDSNILITYAPNAQKTTLEFVDDDNGGAVVGQPTTISGTTDGIIGWNTNNKPAHYTLASGQPTSGTYIFKAGSNTPIQIHLNHVLDYTTTTSTRTIHYVVDKPSYTGQVPAPKVETITWKVVTDEVSGDSVATPQGAYYEVTSPDLSGYKADPTKVGQQAVGSVIARDVPMYNEDVVVTYQPTGQTGPSNSGPKQPGGSLTGNPTVVTPGKVPTGTTTATPGPGTAITGTKTPGKTVTSTSTPNSGTAVSKPTAKKAGLSVTTGRDTGTAETSGASTLTVKANNETNKANNGSNSVTSVNQSKVAKDQQLPQTNEQSHSEVGIGLLGLLTSMLGLIGLKRRQRHDE